jgi:small subunit ribosomal protein S3
MAARGVQGARIVLGGRLGGAEIARGEEIKRGSIPLQTFRADIDYALAEAHTAYGIIGVKVWICKGEVYGKRDLSPNVGSNASSGVSGGSSKGRDNNDRGGRGDRNKGGRGGRNDRGRDRNKD